MKLKDFVFVLNSFKCNKNCPYCIAKMNNNYIENLNDEIKNLEKDILEYQSKNIKFEHFILSGNGETSLYDLKVLNKIKNIVEDSKIFDDYRIQTSGNLFLEDEKLELFENWIKEITVVSDNPSEDKKFYKYKRDYLNSSNYLNSTRIRVNIVLLKYNFNRLNKIINYYTLQNNVETIALKILDNSFNDSKESLWILNNAIPYSEISKILKVVKNKNRFMTFDNKRFIFKTKNNKILSIHYSFENTYDKINIKKEFKWHNKDIEKGVYGEFSKVIEETQEASDALEQNNYLMYLIEFSDIVGAIEGIAENYNLSLEDLINFSNKVKESKKNE